jgi:hypothetical protein
VLFFAASGATGQEPETRVEREIPPVAACENCTISLRHVATLGRMEDEVSIMRSSKLAMDSHDRFFIAPLGVTGEVAVYDPSGSFAGTIGRSGRGPGELGRVRHVVITPGDSLLVLDAMRLTLFSPTGDFVRGRQLPNGVQGFRYLALDDGRVLFNNYRQSHPALGLLDETYAEVRFFGRTISTRDLDSLQYMLALSPDGDVFAAQVNYGYVIEVWDTTGTFKHRFVRKVDWFPPWSMEPISRERRRPRTPRRYKPRISGLYSDGQGKLWVCITVADPDWEQASEGDYARLVDTIIDVIEMPSGRLYATQRFDGAIGRILPNGFLYGLEEDEPGLLRFSVWRPELETM